MSERVSTSGLTRYDYIALPIIIVFGVLLEFSSRMLKTSVSNLNEQLLSLFGISLICCAIVVLLWRAGANLFGRFMLTVAVLANLGAQLARTLAELPDADGVALVDNKSAIYEQFLNVMDALTPACFLIGFFALIFQISLSNNRLSAQADALQSEADNRKEAEERAARREKQVRKILDNIHGFALIADRDGSFRSATPRLKEILGYDDEDMADPSLLEALHSRERRSGAHEIQVTHKDGSMRWLYADHVDLLDEPMVNGILSSYVDITGSRMIQDQKTALQHRLLQTQKMESLGVMAGGIAHDFNNALMGIMGYADLALVDMPEHAKQRHLIERIIETTQGASEIAQRILTYAGREQVHLETVELTAMVENLKELLSATISEKAYLKYELAANLTDIEVDARQIEQVIINLVTNASEATVTAGSPIVVRTGEWDIGTEPAREIMSEHTLSSGKYVYLEVTDRGIGMEPAVVDNAFDPFFSTKFTGRGLGLAAVYGIVNSHKGGIELESTRGEGTRVRVYLPVTQREVRDDLVTPSDLDYKGSDRNTVLVVDDDESVRVAVSIMLEHCGFEVRTAVDGIEALEKLELCKDQCKFVLMDIVMPRMNGLLAHREIVKKGIEIPVVFMTGYSDQHLDLGELVSGQAVVLKKPFTFRALRYQLESHKLLK